MNHLLKKATKCLIKSSDSNDTSLLYVNFNYFISPHIKDTSIPYFKNMGLTNYNIMKRVENGEGHLSIEFDNREFEIFVIRGKLHGFLNGTLMSLNQMYPLMMKCREIYVNEFKNLKNKAIKMGKIYINVKVLYVDSDVNEFKNMVVDILETKYNIVIDEELNEFKY